MNPHTPVTDRIPGRTRPGRRPSYPASSWYVAALGDEVGRAPVGRRVLDTSVVLWRTGDGTAVALEDRDVHRPYPLSLGRVEGDHIVSSYSGFVYDADGTCVRVPTQAEVPYGARVRAFPVTEQDGLIWVWFGGAGLASLRRPPSAPWLVDPEWATFGSGWTTQASFLLLHENFADITHVAVVDPVIAPPALSAGPVPSLEVEVSETSVSFSREFPPAPLATWHAPLVGASQTDRFAQREEGRFVTPGLWVDSWDVRLDDGAGWGASTFRFTHAVTPVGSGSTQHVWRVSRNFARDAATTELLRPLFTDYYERVRSILETMQGVLDLDGPRADIGVASDTAALQVRRIVARMVADERGL